ncbi:M15 family metallopeptidase [Kosakonia sp. H02]|nr:M15 family metallopeptidase [Kosakonia sp. H02]
MSRLLTQRSEQALCGVHPELVRVVRRALELSPVDFIVIEGLRSQERQRELMQAGVSRTLKSRHLTGHAVDLAPWVNGTIPWNDWQAFTNVALAMKSAAQELNVSLVWGGDWKTFRDGPHFELSREAYP